MDPSLLSESKSPNTKAAVFLVLTKRHPLSVAEIFQNVRENFRQKITYQGVRKVVLHLADGGVISKGSTGKYAISPEWIAKQKEDTRELDMRYWVGDKKLPSELALGECEEYDFFGPKALPYYWIFEEARKIRPDRQKAVIICQNMWPVSYITPKEQAVIAAVLAKKGGFALCRGDTEIDRHFAEFLKKMNIAPKTGVKLKWDFDILACDGFVYELQLEKKAMADWTRIYRSNLPMAQKMAELGKSVSAKRRMKIVVRHDPAACLEILSWAKNEFSRGK